MRRVTLFLVVAALTMLGSVGPGGEAGAKVPGPNGRIAFTRIVDPETDESLTYTANPDGTAMQPLFTADHSESPHWSPDGTEVAVLSPGGLPCCTVAAVIVNPDTGSYRIIPMADPEALFTACTIWSTDGSRLACEGNSESDPSQNGIYTIRSSDGGGLTRITDADGGYDVPIDYSPDGSRIVFGRHDVPGRPERVNSALFVVNVDGSGLRQITPWGFSDNHGSWSPDGTEIAFEHSGSIFTVHPDGTGLAKIPLAVGSRSFAGDVVWSPDGQRMVFLLFTQTGPRTFQEGIATASADGSDVQQVTTALTFDHQPDWGSHPLAT